MLLEKMEILSLWQSCCSYRKPHVNVGTIGHVDHGKTTLTAAITKVLADFIAIIYFIVGQNF